MARLFRFLFNFLRTLSLILVLLVFSTAYFFGDELQAATEDYTREQPVDTHRATIAPPATEVVGLLQDAEGPGPVPLPAFEQKYKLQLKRGFAYLKLSDILYVKAVNGTQMIRTTSGQQFSLGLTLSNIGQLLEEHAADQFFSTKSAIINCTHVQGVIKDYIPRTGSYEQYAIVQNGDSISLSRNKYSELLNIMDEQFYVSEAPF